LMATEGGGVIEFDGHRQKGPPVAFCGAPRYSQSPAEGALVRHQCTTPCFGLPGFSEFSVARELH